MFSDYPYVSGTTRTLVEHFRDTASRLVKSYDLKPAQLVVDIGSNDGTWLKQYAPYGLTVQGVEPAANVAALAVRDGIDTKNRFFNEETAKSHPVGKRQGGACHGCWRVLPFGGTAQRRRRRQNPARRGRRVRGPGDLSRRHGREHRPSIRFTTSTCATIPSSPSRRCSRGTAWNVSTSASFRSTAVRLKCT